MMSILVTSLQKRLGFLTSEHVLSSLLLSCAVISVFLLQNHVNGFEEGAHGSLSSHGMTLAKSLFRNNHLLMFTQKLLLDNGTISYEVYNRFPFFPFLIVGAATRVFEPNLALQIYVARQVMNLFFVLSIVICFKITNELVHNALLSLSVSLVAFSSYYMLYYNDMIFNDTPALLGFALALFVVVKSQASMLNVWLIALLSLVSISMGWQPYAVFVSWFLVDTLDLFRTNKLAAGKYRSIATRPSFIALTSAIVWGAVLLGFQLINELASVNWSFQSSSINAALWRFGLFPEQAYAPLQNVLNWRNFLVDQAYRVVRMIVPFAGVIKIDSLRTMAFVISLILVGGLAINRHRIHFVILSTFVLSGILWALPMRHFVAFHDFQSVYYVGLSILFFTVSSFYLNPNSSRIVAIVACLLFILSIRNMNVQKESIAYTVNPVTQEFQVIYDRLPKNSTVFIEGDRHRLGMGYHAVDFFLIDSYSASLAKAEYVISANPAYNQERLTDNLHINLFRNTRKP